MKSCINRGGWWRIWSVHVLALFFATVAFCADPNKPNILVIFGDDVGQTDISAYSMGLMGFHTPNIDRIAKEGLIFTHYYAENSCTAGRATFITGQSAWRTGLTKVGVPGAPISLQARDITNTRLGAAPIRPTTCLPLSRLHISPPTVRGGSLASFQTRL